MTTTNFTYGMELEFGDIFMRDLPSGLSWNRKDYSIVSSTGIANDPKGSLYNRGGEINSEPSDSILGQILLFGSLLGSDLEPQVNHRTNLHLHVGVPGLDSDLPLLKRIFAYIERHQDRVYSVIEPIPEPSPEDYPDEEAFKGAKKRYKRRKVSHQYKVPSERVERIMSALTVKEFLESHAPRDKSGKPAWGVTTRAGMNLLQIKETETIEFRHFTNTLDPEELFSCFQWVKNFVEAALDDAPIDEVFNAFSYKFPPFQPYNHMMEIGYQYTNFDKNSRKVVTERISDLRKHIDIETCQAADLVKVIRSISPEFAT